MKKEKKSLSLKSLILITVILPVLVIAVSSVAIYFTAISAVEQKTVDPSFFENEAPAVENLPETQAQAHELFIKLCEDAEKSGIIRYSGETMCTVSEISAENESMNEILSFASGSFAERFSAVYEKKEIKYGEDASHILTLLPAAVPDDFKIESADGKITIVLNYSKASGNLYYIKDDMKAINSFTSENSGVFSVINRKCPFKDSTYTLRADIKSGKVEELRIERSYNYSARLSFKGSLSELEDTVINMTPVFSDNYTLSYAGITLENKHVTLTKNGYETLAVSANTEEGLSEDEYSLTFSSSDESVVKVDENGQIEAVSVSDKPVIITVTLKYLGKEFTETCTVYSVEKEVESVSIDKTDITLKKGDSTSLSASASPEKATVKDIGFFSSDESVVSVTSDGKITATGTGTATVTAVSLQGLYAVECTVTVTD